MYRRAAKAQTRLCICAASSEPTLIATQRSLAQVDTPEWCLEGDFCAYARKDKISCNGSHDDDDDDDEMMMMMLIKMKDGRRDEDVARL